MFDLKTKLINDCNRLMNEDNPNTDVIEYIRAIFYLNYNMRIDEWIPQETLNKYNGQ
jgi:hypothetical protein